MWPGATTWMMPTHQLTLALHHASVVLQHKSLVHHPLEILKVSSIQSIGQSIIQAIQLSHPVFKAKTRCSSYVCPGSSCHTYGQNVSTEYQCLYYIVSYYKNLLQVQKGLNSGMDPILPQAVDRGFCMPRRNLHPHTPHLLSSRT
jgi:hypothetical protein